MRPTFVIEDDVLAVARSLAEAEGKSLGDVISQLAHRGLAQSSQEAADESFPVFSLPPDAKPITLEAVKRGTRRRPIVARLPVNLRPPWRGRTNTPNCISLTLPSRATKLRTSTEVLSPVQTANW
jgi:hypothetical protein